MRHYIGALIVSVVGLSIPVACAGDESGAVRQMLERLAGDWTWTSQQVNIGAEYSPYGQAGRFVGRGEGRLIMDGQCIINEYQEKTPEGNILHGVSLIGYDPIKKCFAAHDRMSDGSYSVAELTIDGRIRKDRITITSKTGETLLARVVGEYSRDWKRLEVTWEASTDKGESWKHWCTAVFEKAGEGTSDEQELIRLQQEWLRTETARGDVARFMADEYALVTSEGTTITKPEMLRFVQSDDFPFTSMTAENLKVQVFGAAAVVKGLLRWSDKNHKTGHFLFTDTWLKRDGRWQCLATHESGMKETGLGGYELSPEMKKLEVFVGEWTYEGEQTDPPMGQAGSALKMQVKGGGMWIDH